jgi:DNA-binding FadR family transcriptional regulator
MDANSPETLRRRPRSLASSLVASIGDRIRAGAWTSGERLPTEAAIMAEFGVSRTVVREALSKLQAAGLVETRHGVGTFAMGPGDAGAAFRVAPEQMATLRDVIAVLELRIGVETEAAGLAALRRGDEDLARMRAALSAFSEAVSVGGDAVGPDFQFHLAIARATSNGRFVDLMSALGTSIIPRARLDAERADPAERAASRTYLARVNLEHESILAAIEAGDAEAARAAMRTHLANSRERRRRAADLGR